MTTDNGGVMGNRKLQQLSVYLDGKNASVVRAAAKANNLGISSYLKVLIERDLLTAVDDREESRASLAYIRTSVDALMDELWKLPSRSRSPEEKPLRQKVRELHAKRFGGASDAN